MKHFFTVTNIKKDKERKFTEDLRAYIESKGGTCTCYYSRGSKDEAEHVELDQIPKETECILVLGGDGTLIRAARDLHELDLPMIGINLGTLGYLCELESSSAKGGIDEIMQDHHMIEKRMMVEGCCIVKGIRQRSCTAFNDVIIHRGGNPSVSNLILRVNGEYLHTYTGDGIVVATPTGSTAYNLSAGGPIVDPKAELLLVTPINSHSLNSKSIVLSAEDEIEIEISARNHETEEYCEVRFDGDNSVRVGIGDRILIQRAENSTNILKLSKRSFLEILGKKMQAYI